MPTPDETAFPPPPPIDIPARSSFPSCPPEEDREEPRDESDDDNNDDGEDEEAAAPPADHAIAQEPTPEPDALEGASSESHNAQSQSKDTPFSSVRHVREDVRRLVRSNNKRLA